MPTQALDYHINKFIEYLGKSKHRTRLTREHYQAYLEHFMDVTGASSLRHITPALVSRYKRELKSQGLSHTTQNYYLIALRNFIKYLPEGLQPISRQEISLYPVRYAPRAKTPASVIRKVLAAPTTSSKNSSSMLLLARDHALLALLYDTGLTLQQLSSLQRSHIHLTQSRLVVTQKQTSNALPISRSTTATVRTYLQLRHDTNPYVFIPMDRASGGTDRTAKKQGLSPRSIQRLVIRAARTNGIADVTMRSIKQAARLR